MYQKANGFSNLYFGWGDQDNDFRDRYVFQPPPTINLYPAVEMSSAKCLDCNNFQIVSKSLKNCENVVRLSNSLDPGETTSYSASRPDPSCLHIKLWSRSAG